MRVSERQRQNKEVMMNDFSVRMIPYPLSCSHTHTHIWRKHQFRNAPSETFITPTTDPTEISLGHPSVKPGTSGTF